MSESNSWLDRSDARSLTARAEQANGFFWEKLRDSGDYTTRQPWPPDHNWADSQRWAGATRHAPATLNALKDVVRRSAGPVGIVGFAGAWSPMLAGCKTVISLHHFKAITIHGAGAHVKVQAGCTMGEIDAFLRPHGLCMRTSTVIPHPTVGGVLATGAHGTGKDRGMVADYAIAMDVMDAQGVIRTYGPADACWSALLLNLGVCGVVVSVTFQVEPMYRVRVQDIPHTWCVDAFMDPAVVQATLEQHEFAELFWWPLDPHIWVKLGSRTTQALRGQTQVYLNDVAHTKGGPLLKGLGPYMNHHPEETPNVMAWMSKAIFPMDAVVEAPHAFHYQLAYPPCWDMCYAIPVKPGEYQKVVEAWMWVVAETRRLAAAGEFPLNLTLHARWLKSSKAWMSPLYSEDADTHHLMIEILGFKPGPAKWQEFFARVERKWLDLGGRPHWAKGFSWGEQTEKEWTDDQVAQIRRAYGARPGWFETQRKALDPIGKFLTPFVQKFL